MSHTLPNFIIAGCTKAGTTSVYTYLNSHPEVRGSSIKEISFFGKHYTGDRQTDIEKYSSYFRVSPSENPKIIFEATPGYICRAKATAPQIKELIPDVKLLFILREPVAYLYSMYNFSINNTQSIDGQKVSFEEYVRRNVAYWDNNDAPDLDGVKFAYLLRSIKNGKYADSLDEFFKVLPRSNIKVMFYDDLKKDVQSFMSDLCAFLDIDASFYANHDFYRVNKTFAPKNKLFHKLCNSINYIAEPYLRRYPAQKQILTGLYKFMNQAAPGYPQIPEQTREFLQNYYRESNFKLAELLKGQELPGWVRNGYSTPHKAEESSAGPLRTKSLSATDDIAVAGGGQQ